MEIAFISSNKLRYELDKENKSLSSKILGIFYRNPNLFISTMLVGNNIALVVYGLQMAIVLEPVIAKFVANEALIVFIQSIISTLLILFTGEFIPKTIFKLNPNLSLNLFSVPLLILYILLYPLSKLSSLLSFVFLKLGGVKNLNSPTGHTLGRVDLDYFIQQSIEDAPPHSDIDTEVKIFQNALDFSKVRLRDCIVPRTEIVASDTTVGIDELRTKFIETGLSKILVYNENIDDIIGYIHSSELFKHPDDWTRSIKSVPIVPETMAANKLMKLLMQDKKSLAVVVDEFGGTSGIVTMEDILEEIVGEISDEYDEDEKQFYRQEDGSLIFEAKILLTDFFRVTEIDPAIFGKLTEEVETLAGLLLEIKGDFPQRREIVDFPPYRFQVLEVDNRRILKVKFTRIPEPEKTEAPKP